MLTTHALSSVEAVPISKLEEMDAFVDDFDVIGVDEGQFYEDLAVKCEEYANKGKVVIISGLSSTFERKAFPQIAMVMPLVEELTKLTAICLDCGGEANFTSRTTNETELELIGGLDHYKPVCRKCYFKK